MPADLAPRRPLRGGRPQRQLEPDRRSNRSNARRKISRSGLWMPSASEIRTASKLAERAKHSSLRLCIRLEPFVISRALSLLREGKKASGRHHGTTHTHSEIWRGSQSAASWQSQTEVTLCDQTGEQIPSVGQYPSRSFSIGFRTYLSWSTVLRRQQTVPIDVERTARSFDDDQAGFRRDRRRRLYIR